MIKRPQSAAVTRTQYNAFKNDEVNNDNNISSYSKLSYLRPTSGISDKTQIKKKDDYQNLFNQARYSLELNSFSDAITLFSKALTSAVSVLTSLQFIELYGQSIQILNDKAKQLIDNRTNPDIIITALMQWTQLSSSSTAQYQFLRYIKCPTYY